MHTFLLSLLFAIVSVFFPSFSLADETATKAWFQKAGAVVIVVPASVELHGIERVSLGDVAQFEAPEKGESIVAELKEIRLGLLPSPGKPLRIAQQSIAKKVQRLVNDRIGYYINMPSQELIVKAASRKITAEEIREQAERYLQKRYAEQNINAEVISILFNRDLNVPEEGELHTLFRFSGKPVSGKLMLRMQLRGSGGYHETETFPVEIRLYKDVLVAQRDIPAGETVSETDIALEERDITDMRKVPLLQPVQVIGYATVRDVPAGTVIIQRNLKSIPAIKRGASVVMVAEGASFRLTAPGVAQQNGGMNETIRVLNPGSKKIIYGTVIGKDVVRIPF